MSFANLRCAQPYAPEGRLRLDLASGEPCPSGLRPFARDPSNSYMRSVKRAVRALSASRAVRSYRILVGSYAERDITGTDNTHNDQRQIAYNYNKARVLPFTALPRRLRTLLFVGANGIRPLPCPLVLT